MSCTAYEFFCGFDEMVWLCFAYSSIVVLAFLVGHQHWEAFENTSVRLVSPEVECLGIGQHLFVFRCMF